MKTKLLISTVVASLIMGTVSLSANADTTSAVTVKKSAQNSQKVLHLKKSVNREIKVQKGNFKQASKEIMEGLDKTFLATSTLEKKKIEEAKKSLKESIELFETALKAEPKLGLVPIAQEINVHVFEGDAKSLQSYLNTTVEMLKKHNTQEARMRLMPLEDDMIIATQRLPINEYLASTKSALKLLDANKTEEAMESLVTGMSLMEVDMVVIPIPLMVAEDLIIEASTLDKARKDEAQKLLSMAQDELEKAVLLGYTQKHTPEYKALLESISEIRKEIKGKNEVEKLYDKLKDSFHGLLTKSREDVVKQKAQEKVKAYQNKEEKKALDKSKNFNADAKKDEAKTIE